MQLNTQQNFTVVRQLADPNDTGTYFVQAVVRNAYTDTIIATLNLTNKGAQRFKEDWKIPADPSGEGFYISIISTVFDDALYTTKSTVYGAEENTYLVADRVQNTRGAGGLGQRDVRDIVVEELEKLYEKIKPEKPFDFQSILDAVKSIDIEKPRDYSLQFEKIAQELTNLEKIIFDLAKLQLKKEDIKPIELQPILDAISEIKKTVEEKEITKPTDISPILKEFKNTIDIIVEILKKSGEGIITASQKSLKNEIKNLNFIDTETKELAKIQFQKEEDKKESIDINKLNT